MMNLGIAVKAQEGGWVLSVVHQIKLCSPKREGDTILNRLEQKILINLVIENEISSRREVRVT